MEARERLLERVRSLTWVHTIDLGDGVVTPGLWPRQAHIGRAFDAIDFRGKKVLDIGCWDGLWSFEAERRGAREVYATDLLSQRSLSYQPTVTLARDALNSSVHYHPDVSVYDVRKLGVFDFDVVLFCGVYYHLKDPLLAFARLRQVMRAGAILVVEGEVVHGPTEAVARFYYRDKYREDPSNWWVPSVPCLREWIECSYFEVQSEFAELPAPRRTFAGKMRQHVKRLLGLPSFHEVFARHVVLARAVCRHDPVYVYPDEGLHPFNCEETSVTTAG